MKILKKKHCVQIPMKKGIMHLSAVIGFDEILSSWVLDGEDWEDWDFFCYAEKKKAKLRLGKVSIYNGQYGGMAPLHKSMSWILDFMKQLNRKTPFSLIFNFPDFKFLDMRYDIPAELSRPISLDRGSYRKEKAFLRYNYDDLKEKNLSGLLKFQCYFNREAILFIPKDLHNLATLGDKEVKELAESTMAIVTQAFDGESYFIAIRAR